MFVFFYLRACPKQIGMLLCHVCFKDNFVVLRSHNLGPTFPLQP